MVIVFTPMLLSFAFSVRSGINAAEDKSIKVLPSLVIKTRNIHVASQFAAQPLRAINELNMDAHNFLPSI